MRGWLRTRMGIAWRIVGKLDIYAPEPSSLPRAHPRDPGGGSFASCRWSTSAGPCRIARSGSSDGSHAQRFARRSRYGYQMAICRPGTDHKAPVAGRGFCESRNQKAQARCHRRTPHRSTESPRDVDDRPSPQAMASKPSRQAHRLEPSSEPAEGRRGGERRAPGLRARQSVR